MDVRWVARGGGAIVHAIGQLAVTPILPLDRLQINVGEYRLRLETALVATCRDLRVPAKRVPATPGVWCRGGQLASFGAAVKYGTTLHGAVFNVDPDPGFLKMVDSFPPGERLTSLQTALAMLDHPARRREFPGVLAALAERHIERSRG